MTLPRFSLRLLLLAVTVLCAWLAWKRSVVMERRAARTKFEERAVFVFFDDPPATKGVSFVRMALGDEQVELIALSADIAPTERERLSRLFPEASIDPRGAQAQ